MAQKTMTSPAARRLILRLSDAEINSAVLLASTPAVAKIIVRSLPGVRRLSREDAVSSASVLAWLVTEETLADDRRACIALYILEHQPSEAVKTTLATLISERRFTGFTSRLAADAFLVAAQIDVPRGVDPVRLALRESLKIVRKSPSPKEEY